jgi:hypothetical protein
VLGAGKEIGATHQKETTMKKFCALIVFAVAAAFGTPADVSAQTNSPVITDTSSQVPQTVVYDGWSGNYWTHYGHVVQVQPYGLPCQPVYTVRYYTVQQPSVCCYTQSTYYYSQPCWQPVRRSCFRFCR